MKDKLAIKISGPAGTGIMQAGETFSKALNRLGFFTLVYPEYPSQIRGGDNNLQVIFSSEKVFSPQEKIDLLLAFNKNCLAVHKGEVKKDGLILDSEKIGIDEAVREEGEFFRNTIGLGFLWSVLGLDLAVLEDQLRQDFGGREKVLELNLKAAKKGFESNKKFFFRIDLPKTRGKIVNLSGNEILTKGILAAECGFASIYPMTPINLILTLLAKEKSVTVFRPEDEVAGINAAIGAAYAGKRAMVATSGGGFSLMVESLGMAGMTETPLVIILGQRTGPSTGIATYSSQADLKFAISAGQGEFPRIVLAPGDLTELYNLGAEAFNLAEVYQVPVILLTDKYLAESRFSAKTEEIGKVKVKIDRGKLANKSDSNNYRRYELAKDGISPRAFPGQTTFLTNSYEHDEFGFSTDEIEIRKKMMNKRMGKLAKLKSGFEIYGDRKARETLVSWGSTKEVLLDYIGDHQKYNLVHIWRPWPFPMEVKKILGKSKKIICVEGNYSGQMADLIELKTGLKVERILKDDGRPFFKEEIEKLISNV